MPNDKNSIANKSLLSLTWPIFIDLFFIFMISVTDAWFLSRISDNAAAAVGAMMPILGIGFALYSTLHQAGNSIASQRLGAKDFDMLAGTYGSLLLLSLFIGLCMATLFIFGADNLISLMGISNDLAEISKIYLQTLGMGTWILALKFGATAILSSQGKTQWNMWSTALMSFLNIIFNYLLIDGKLGIPALGVQGIALASVLAWGLSLLFTFYIIYRHLAIKIRFPTGWQSLKTMSAPILKIAMPSTIEPMSWQLTQLIMTAMIVAMGTIALATRIYTFNLLFVPILYGIAISSGVQIKVGFYIGSRQIALAQQELVKGIKIGLVGVIVFMTILISFSQYFYRIFTDNQDIWLLGSSLLLVAILGEIGRSFNLIVGASLRACGDAKYTSIVGFISMWAIALPLAWLFGIHLTWGLLGIWLGSSIDEAIRGFSNMRRWNSKRWQSKGLYSKSNIEEPES